MSLHEQLRRATRSDHVRLESMPMFEALMSRDLRLESYVAWLRVLVVVVGALERGLDRSDDPRVGRLWSSSQPKLPLLHADTAQFDDVHPTGHGALQPCVELVDAIRRWQGPELVGGLYVFEGSMMGGQAIRKALRETFGFDDTGLTYLSAHGAMASEYWRDFCRRLDMLELDDADAMRAIDAATQVFAGLCDIVKSIHASDGPSLANLLNADSGNHKTTRDPRELVAALDAGVATWTAYPYYEARYGERGRRFTRTDSAWLVTLSTASDAHAASEIAWLSRLLSTRGMPSVLLEEHLRNLCAALELAVPERAPRYRTLDRLARRLGKDRLEALPAFSAIASSFPHSEPVANVGPVLAGAVADERLGVEMAVPRVVSWLADPERFSGDWCDAVHETVAHARAAW